MNRLLAALLGKPRREIRDTLEPRGGTLQIVLKRKGQPVAGIFVDDRQEVRSPSLEPEES